MPLALKIEPGNPGSPGAEGLLRRHLDEMHAYSPEGAVFALDVDGLSGPDITFWVARAGQQLVACGALKELDPSHAEVKSMHTHSDWRGQGVAARFVEFLIEEAKARGFRRLSLETGSTEAYAGAVRLYSRLGFELSGPFGTYKLSEHSTFMSMPLG